MQFAHDAHRALIADFLDALDEERDPRANGAEGAATQHLIETILASARN
jgi:predicted dehydrogenase